MKHTFKRKQIVNAFNNKILDDDNFLTYLLSTTSKDIPMTQKSLDKKKQLLIKTKKDKISSKRQCESCQHMGKGECNAFKCIARNYCDWEEIKKLNKL